MSDFNERWSQIQRTREVDPNTREPVPGSLGVAYIMWMNNVVEKAALMARVGEDKATIQRPHGGQIMDVSLADIRTEEEVIAYLNENHPDLIPPSRKGWIWYRTLPASVLREIWGK